MKLAIGNDREAELKERLEYSHRLSLLDESRISPEVILARGYSTVSSKAELAPRGFESWQQRVPALLVPMYGPSGRVTTYQIKPDSPRKREGKLVKYETPARSELHLDVHPNQAERVKDPGVPLWVTEGVKKGDCLVSQGECAVALQGVWCWQKGGRELPEWDFINLRGRRVYVAFDSDVMVKRDVQVALRKLVTFLKERGALVTIVYLPDKEDGGKQGVDDYLGAGRTIQELLTHAQDDLRVTLGEVGTLLSDVEPERVEWLWEGRIPKGKLTILDGDPGLGKSLIAMDLAARVTAGRMFPYTTVGDLGGLGGVVLLSGEDGLADTIRPRLDAAGADAGKVLAVSSVSDGQGGERTVSIPEDMGTIERAVERVSAKLVVIDPLMSFLSSSINPNSDQEVRRALTPLAKMAERLSVAILVIRHMNKQETRKSLYRGGGSIGIIGAARSAFVVEEHPGDNELRVLAISKGNLAKKADSLTYRITSVHGVARIEWEGSTNLDADELLNPNLSEEARAKGLLEDILKDGPVLQEEVKDASEGAEIAWRTIERVKGPLGIRSKKDGVDGKWRWHLTHKDRQDRQLRHGGQEGNMTSAAALSEAS